MKCFVLTSPVGSPLFIVIHCGYSELDYFDHLALSLFLVFVRVIILFADSSCFVYYLVCLR